MTRTAQQIIGREGETATLLSRCLLNSELRGGGFAPRQLNRYVSRIEFSMCGKMTARKLEPNTRHEQRAAVI